MYLKLDVLFFLKNEVQIISEAQYIHRLVRALFFVIRCITHRDTHVSLTDSDSDSVLDRVSCMFAIRK